VILQPHLLRLPPIEYRLDDIQRERRQPQHAAHVAAVDPFAARQLPDRPADNEGGRNFRSPTFASCSVLSEAWRALLETMNELDRRDILRFAGWCSSLQIEPGDVTEQIVGNFLVHLRTKSIQRHPKGALAPAASWPPTSRTTRASPSRNAGAAWSGATLLNH
jgi:hypothetical protein